MRFVPESTIPCTVSAGRLDRAKTVRSVPGITWTTVLLLCRGQEKMKSVRIAVYTLLIKPNVLAAFCVQRSRRFVLAPNTSMLSVTVLLYV